MDLGSLRKGLQFGKYHTLGDFLRDAELIWRNCRLYNGQSGDGFFARAANACERAFVQALSRVRALGVNWAAYR